MKSALRVSKSMDMKTTTLNRKTSTGVHQTGLEMYKIVLFVACCCFALSKAQTVSPSCPLVMTPSSVVVQYGDPLIVDCNSTTTEREGMGWESDYKGTGAISADHVQLKIDKVDKWSINSQCYMNLNNGDQCSKNLPITVYKIPDSVNIEPPKTNQPMEEHKEYQFQCAVVNVAPVNNVSVTWYKNNQIIETKVLSSESEKTPLNGSSLYTLRAQMLDNGGNLRCEAKFDFGPTGPNLPPVTSPPVDLQVLYQPFFDESKMETVEVPANGKITLGCTANGNPTPQYHWQVPQPNLQKVGSGPILNLTRPFPGTYNCTASNSQGSSIKQFLVTDAPRDYTVLAAVVGAVAALGVLLLIIGPFFVTKDGTFSFNKGGYSKGQPSQPI